MDEQISIPVSKVQRASKFVVAGAKVGRNYLKHYSKKALNQKASKEELDEANATDIYDFLSELKGSALKAAQMLSMDQSILPKAFADKFKQAQYSAPPLSYPLVVHTFKKYMNQGPLEMFDTFTEKAVNAASIGQVHLATLNGDKYAVKVQYPGVADSVSNDLRMAKTVAAKIINIKTKDLEYYMDEIEGKMLEETDYELELRRSITLASACQEVDHVNFPTYFPALSSKRILTMSWVEGQNLNDWLASEPNQQERNRIGQALWDFYDFQIHHLKIVHADPHPGNFIITPEMNLGVIDFGCVKEIPDEFYQTYFKLMEPGLIDDIEKVVDLAESLQLLHSEDSKEERLFFISLFKDMIGLMCQPIYQSTFDFGDITYFDQVYKMVEELSKNKGLRKANGARGPRDGIYINRTYFGIYSILHEIRAEVKTQRWNRAYFGQPVVLN